MNPFPLVRIIWIDASGSDETGWTELGELLEQPDRALMVESVGWLVHDGKMVKRIAQNLNVPDAEIGSYPSYFHDVSITVAQTVLIEELIAKPAKRKRRTIKPAAKKMT